MSKFFVTRVKFCKTAIPENECIIKTSFHPFILPELVMKSIFANVTVVDVN